jgi:hypothetical protein
MPADPTQLNSERLEALIETLVAEGVLPRDWADSIESTEQIGDGLEIAEAAREGRGPPDFVGGPDDPATNGGN